MEVFRMCTEGAEYAWRWKFFLREQILGWMEGNGGVAAWDKVLFLDADSLALRNVDHLLLGDWDIGFHHERGRDINTRQFNCFLTDDECVRWKRDGVNSETLAVRASKYDEVMQRWELIDRGPLVRESFCRDQGSWNRAIIECEEAGMTTHAFPAGEVAFPLFLQPRYHES